MQVYIIITSLSSIVKILVFNDTQVIINYMIIICYLIPGYISILNFNSLDNLKIEIAKQRLNHNSK